MYYLIFKFLMEISKTAILNNINNDLEITNKFSNNSSLNNKNSKNMYYDNINNNLYKPLLNNSKEKNHLVIVNKGNVIENNAFGKPLQKISSVFNTSLYLGFICFGGPAAHIGVFKKVFIDEKALLNEKEFAMLFSICNVLPGPTSTQLFTAISTITTNSVLGGFVNFLAFNMPGLIFLISIACYFNYTESLDYSNLNSNKISNDELVHNSLRIAFFNGISQAAIALIIQAGISLAKKQSKLKIRYLIMLLFSIIVYSLFNKNYYVMILIMSVNGLFNLIYKTYKKPNKTTKLNNENLIDNFEESQVNLLKNQKSKPDINITNNINEDKNIPKKLSFNNYKFYKSNTFITNQINKNHLNYNSNLKHIKFTGILPFSLMIIVYLILLIFKLSFFNINNNNSKIKLLNTAEIFYRIGFLVLGGGHVIIPMILSEFTSINYISNNTVMLAFSLTSIMPGPLFNISGFVGTIINGLFGGIVASICLFTPGLLLVFSVLPILNYIKRSHYLLRFLKGVSVSAIGFIFTSAIILYKDICLDKSLNLPNIILNTFNIAMCFYLLEIKNVNTLLVLLFGIIYSIITVWILL